VILKGWRPRPVDHSHRHRPCLPRLPYRASTEPSDRRYGSARGDVDISTHEDAVTVLELRYWRPGSFEHLEPLTAIVANSRIRA
jgi:hypothetical protein